MRLQGCFGLLGGEKKKKVLVFSTIPLNIFYTGEFAGVVSVE